MAIVDATIAKMGAAEAQTHKIKWKVNLPKEFNGSSPNFDQSNKAPKSTGTNINKEYIDPIAIANPL